MPSSFVVSLSRPINVRAGENSDEPVERAAARAQPRRWGALALAGGRREERTFSAASLFAPVLTSMRAMSAWPFSAAMYSGVAPFCARRAQRSRPDARA